MFLLEYFNPTFHRSLVPRFPIFFGLCICIHSMVPLHTSNLQNWSLHCLWWVGSGWKQIKWLTMVIQNLAQTIFKQQKSYLRQIICWANILHPPELLSVRHSQTGRKFLGKYLAVRSAFAKNSSLLRYLISLTHKALEA